jgi:DNA-binding NtrC family response regulator
VLPGLGVPSLCVGCSRLQELPESFNLPEFLDHVEKSLIGRTLQSGGRTQAEAARKLGLSRSVLSYKLSKYSLRADSD